jgi:5-bromo-4-chloroindolyl phosphate hydrolysis protein
MPSGTFVIAILLIASMLFIFALRLVPTGWVVSTVTTAGVFFVPLLLGGTSAIRGHARLARDMRAADRLVKVAIGLENERAPANRDAVKHFERKAGEPRTISARIVERVARACLEYRYEPVVSILALDMPEIRYGSRSVRKAQLFAIRLGIVTTFVGLMLGLFEIAPVLGDLDGYEGGKAIGNVAKTMAAAFGGSVGGLLAAMVLQILGSRSELLETDLLAKIEDAILAVQSFFYNADSKEPIRRSMNALGSEIGSFRKLLDEARNQIVGAENRLHSEIRRQDVVLREREQEMQRGRDALTELVNSQTRALSALEQTMRSASERIASEIRTWVDAEVKAAAAAALATGLGEGRKALNDHAEVVERSLSEVNRQAARDFQATGTILEAALIKANRESLKDFQRVAKTLEQTTRLYAHIRTLLIAFVVLLFVALAIHALG